MTSDASTTKPNVHLTINNSDKIEGTIQYLGVNCTESWEETSRTLGTIYVEEKLLTGDATKCGNAEWKSQSKATL